MKVLPEVAKAELDCKKLMEEFVELFRQTWSNQGLVIISQLTPEAIQNFFTSAERNAFQQPDND